MDRNGYNASLFVTEFGKCYICGNECYTERHEVFGAANRSKSKYYGLWVDLCPDCHRYSPLAVHRNKSMRLKLQQEAQRLYQEEFGDDFMQKFGRNYL